MPSRLSPLRVAFIALVLVTQMFVGTSLATHSGVTGPDFTITDADTGVAITGDAIKKWFVTSGATVTSTVTIKNVGSASTSSAFYVEVRDTDTSPGLPDGVSPILACPRVEASWGINEARTVTITWVVPNVPNGDDDHTVRYYVNPDTTANGGCGNSHPAERAVVPTADSYANNAVTLHFAVNRKPNLRIDEAASPLAWCVGASHTTGATTCDDVGIGDNFDRTSYDTDDKSYFAARVANGKAGQSAGIYQFRDAAGKVTLPGSTTALPIDLRVRVTEVVTPSAETNLDSTTTTLATDSSTALSGSCGPLEGTECTNFKMFRRAGQYVVTFRVDPDGKLPDADPNDNEVTRTVTVRAVELKASFDFNPLKNIPGQAYQEDTLGTPILPASGSLRFNVKVENVGTIDAAGQGPIAWRVFIVNPTGQPGESDRELPPDSAASLNAGASDTTSYQYDYVDYATNPNAGNALRGGRIVLRVVLDNGDATSPAHADDNYAEPCENRVSDTVGCSPSSGSLQNVVESAVKIVDNVKPTVQRWGWSVPEAQATFNLDDVKETTPFEITKKEPIQMTVVLSDNDQALHTATNILRLNMTKTGAAQQQFLFPTGSKDNGGFFWFNYTFANGITDLGAYQVTLDVQDSFGNRPATAVAVRAASVIPWPIQDLAKSPEELGQCLATTPCDGSKLWIEKPPRLDVVDQGYKWEIKVGKAKTGIDDAQCHPAGTCNPAVTKKWITIWKPDGTKHRDHILLTSGSFCPPANRDQVTGQCNAGGYVNTDRYFHEEFGAITALGRWSSLIEIEDQAGDVRKLWWNFTIRDELPDVSILDAADLDQVDAGEAMTLKVEVVDETTPGKVLANMSFKQADGSWITKTFDMGAPSDCTGAGTGFVCKAYTRTIPTGWLTDVALDGNWKLTVDAKEGAGARLNASADHAVEIVDTRPPSITANNGQPVASAKEEEFGFPVTWNVTGSDDTDWRPYLTVIKADGTLLGDEWNLKPMSVPNAQGVSTYASGALPIGSYKWKVTLRDSAGRTINSNEFPLDILENTAPRIALTQPTLPVGEPTSVCPSCPTYFAGKRPVVTALIYDNDGVELSTLKFLVGYDGGNLAEISPPTLWVRPSTNPLGYIVQYNHTKDEPHGTVLIVEFKAKDKSSPANEIPGDKQRTILKIDAQAPESQTPDVSQPKYRSSASHAWNITADTLFKLTALDPQGAGVDRVEYSLDAVEGPYTKAEAAGFRLQASARAHTLYYRAVDKLENKETPKFLRIWVDTEAPFINPAQNAYEVDDKWTNFTITDSGTGVASASTWYKVNNAEYKELALVYSAEKNMWVGQLPALTHGDELRIYATAKDFLGNLGAWGSADNPPGHFKVGNRRPVITLLEPLNNVTVAGKMTISWEAEDPDGDTMEITILYRPEGTTDWRYAARNLTKAKGTFEFDTTTILDGKYDFDVSAFDGERFGRVVFGVTVRNSQPPIRDVKLPTATPAIGQGLLISAVVTKPDVVSVTAKITRDGVVIADAIELNDAGKSGDLLAGDHIYGVTYTPDAPGKYQVEIAVKYREGGEVKDYKKLTSFDVQATSIWVVQDNPLLVAAIAAFGLGVVGLAAWGLSRRWS